MPAPKVRADYDQLGQIAGTFASLADGVKQTTQNVQSRMQTLQNDDWVGDSANTFYAEMQDVVLPAMKRLSDALQEAGRVTINIRQVMEQAERDVAGVFAATPEAAPKTDDGGILSAIGNGIGDFVSGVFEEGKGMVEGIVNMVAHPIQTLEGLAFAVTHPDKLWDALTKPYVDDWNSGHPWKAIGRGALNVALLIGTAGIGEAGAAAGEGANAVGKVGELAGAASKLGEVGEAGETATLAARTAEAAELARSAEVAEVARGAEVAEAARGAELSEAVRGGEAGMLAKEGISGTEQILNSSNAVIDPSKLDYIFGRVTSGPHNTARSLENLSQMQKIGLIDSPESYRLIQNHLKDIVQDSSNIMETYGNRFGNYQVENRYFGGQMGPLNYKQLRKFYKMGH